MCTVLHQVLKPMTALSFARSMPDWTHLQCHGRCERLRVTWGSAETRSCLSPVSSKEISEPLHHSEAHTVESLFRDTVCARKWGRGTWALEDSKDRHDEEGLGVKQG